MTIFNLKMSMLHGLSRIFHPKAPNVENGRKKIRHDVRNTRRRARAAEIQDQAAREVVEGTSFQTVARTEPLRYFNGDFYGVHQYEDGRVAFYIGDVSGHGIPAAFYQTSCLTLLRQCARQDCLPSEAVEEVNSILAARLEENRFATLLYGILDPRHSSVTLVSAGHPLPFLIAPDGKVRKLESLIGLPVGLSTEQRYGRRVYPLSVGDTLFCYSDGLVEARNRARAFFGEGGLENLLIEHGYLPLDELVETVMSEILGFSGRRQDDQTALALRLAAEGSETGKLESSLLSQAVACA